MKYAGSCLCGQASFEVEGEFESFFLCHCRHCRKDTGSAHAANLFSTTATLRWLSGEELLTHFRLPASRHARSFCSSCGSALPGMQMEGTLLVVPAGSLDDDLPIEPQGHIFVASKANWDEGLETVRRFEKYPD